MSTWASVKESFPPPANPQDGECETLFRFHNALDGGGITPFPTMWSCGAVTRDMRVHVATPHGVVVVPCERSDRDAPTPTHGRLHCVRVLSHDHSNLSVCAVEPPTGTDTGGASPVPTIAFLVSDGVTQHTVQRVSYLYVLTPTVNSKRRRDGVPDSQDPFTGIQYLVSTFMVSVGMRVVAVSPMGDCIAVLPQELPSKRRDAPMYVVCLGPSSPAQRLHETRLSFGPAQASLAQRLRGRRKHSGVLLVAAFFRCVGEDLGAVELLVQSSRGQFVGFAPRTSCWECTGVLSLSLWADLGEGTSEGEGGAPSPHLGMTNAFTHPVSAAAVDCAPAWRFTERWLHSQRFLEGLAASAEDQALRSVFEATLNPQTLGCSRNIPVSLPHQRAALKRRVRSGVRVMCRTGASGSVALLELGGDKGPHLVQRRYAVASLPLFSRKAPETRDAPCVEVAGLGDDTFDDSAFILDATPVTARAMGEVSGFLALVLHSGSERRRRSPISGAVLLAEGTESVSLVFISLSGVAAPVQLSPWTVTGMSFTRVRAAGPKTLQAFAEKGNMIHLVSLERDGINPPHCGPHMWSVVVDRDVSSSDSSPSSASASVHRLMAAIVLPDASAVVRQTLAYVEKARSQGQASRELRDRLSCLVSLSIQASVNLCRPPTPVQTDQTASLLTTTHGTSALALELYEYAEGQLMAPAPKVPEHRRPSSSTASVPWTGATAIPVVEALLGQLWSCGGDDHAALTADGIVQVFKGVAQALSAMHASDTLQLVSVQHSTRRDEPFPSHLPLLQGLAACLREGVEYFTERGLASHLLSAVSHMCPEVLSPAPSAATAGSSGVENGHIYLQAMFQPLFDAAYPCILVAFPALAEDILPFCSADMQHSFATANKLLPVRRRSLSDDSSAVGGHHAALASDIISPSTNATMLVSGVLARVQGDAGGLGQLTQREVEFTAHRLFLEDGPRAAMAFLAPFVDAPSCSQPVKALHSSYARLCARVEDLLV